MRPHPCQPPPNTLLRIQRRYIAGLLSSPSPRVCASSAQIKPSASVLAASSLDVVWMSGELWDILAFGCPREGSSGNCFRQACSESSPNSPPCFFLSLLQDNYPEVETLWLMTKAWNTGIFQYSSGKYKEAEQWCGLGMRFLHHLGSLKSSYESNVSECKRKAELSCRRTRVLWKELFQKDWTS